jgi:Tol biopolymer transport system component
MSHTPPTDEPRNEAPLESWKEIAAYLKRDVRTAKRWETGEGLPVRRHMHQTRASVYAYPSELAVWVASRQPSLEPGNAGRAIRWQPLIGLAASLALAMATVGSPIPTQAGQAASNPNVTVRKVWATGNSDATGAPSPDGRYLSFADWLPGDLGIHDLSSGENRAVTREGSWGLNRFAYYSIWSPDAKQVAYFWMNGDRTEVRITGVTAGDPRVLYVNPEKGNFGIRPMAWSADGKLIAGHLSRSDATNQIVLLSADTGAVRALKSTEWRYPTAMSFSPDGRWLAFDAQVEQGSQTRDIFLLATDGSREVALVTHPAHDYGPVFTYDGRHLLFVSDRAGANGLWLARVGDDQAQQSVQLLKADVGRMSPMGLTRDGKLYFGYSSGQNAGDVYTASIDPSAGRVIGAPSLAVQIFEGQNTSPAFSPDARRMAYLSRRGAAGAGWSVIIRAVDTGQEVVLRTDLAAVENPRASSLRWSPNGQSLLTAGVDARGRRGLFILDVESAKAQLVVEHAFPVETHPSWSPDGAAIYMIRIDADQKGKSIVERTLRTQAERVLHRAGWMTALTLSPDGTRLAFVQREGEGGTSVTVLKELSIAGGQARTLYRAPRQSINASVSMTWSEDGASLLFTQRAGRSVAGQLAGSETSALWRLPVSGGEPVNLNLEMEGLRNLSIAPGGRQLAFTGGRPFRSEVWVLEDFLPRQPASR